MTTSRFRLGGSLDIRGNQRLQVSFWQVRGIIIKKQEEFLSHSFK